MSDAEWTPGHCILRMDGTSSPRLLLIYDGHGVYQGMLRRGAKTLQYTRDEPLKPKMHRAWRDATSMWASLPKWVRDKAMIDLALDQVSVEHD